MGEMKSVYRILAGKPERERLPGRPRWLSGDGLL
jgi:hypothetical protein